MYLLDTNVISEYRKGTRANRGVQAFFAGVQSEALFLPAQVVGEIQAGIARLRRQADELAAQRARLYESWLEELLETFGARVLEFDTEAARVWGTLLGNEKHDPHTVDKQIAAIALVHDLVVVTRDHGTAFKTLRPVRALDPFSVGVAAG